MINCVIIDDEPLARGLVKEYLNAHADFNVIAECGDGFEGVKAVMQHKPELIFLDVQMPKISGFEMLELLDPAPAVVFTTAFDEYALKAFEMHAVDYLLKPFSKERFDNAIKKWKENRSSSAKEQEKKTETLQQEESLRSAEEKNRVVVKVGGNIRIIPSVDIFYFEAYDDYVKIFTKDDWFLKKKTMSYFEKTLEEQNFLRVHRSFIINLTQLTKIEPYEKDGHLALLKNGAKIPVSRTGYGKLKEALGI